MEFLYFLESIRNPVMDFLMSTITFIGGETVFLVIAILLIWCADKRQGYFTLLTCFFGIVINQTLKLLFKIPRPWVKDPNFTIVESAREEAVGYSFPSGHTQNVAGTFGALGFLKPEKKKWIPCVIIILLVGFSRMYLGVHTLLDVSVSLVIAALLVFGLRFLFLTEERFVRVMPYIIVASYICSLGLLLYTFLMNGEGVDVHNLESGRKNACTLHGATLALFFVWFLDRKYIKYPTHGRWYAQFAKVAIGFGVVLLIKSTLQAPLTALFGNPYVARTVRYFLIVMFAGCVWPLTFRFWSELRVAKLDAFGERVAALFSKKASANDASE